jgi:hypothetical protein
LDQKITFVVRAHVLLRHPLNHPVSHINRVKSHVAFLLPSQPSADIQSSSGSFDHDAKLI